MIVLLHKDALDLRDPNAYSGIFGVPGRCDRLRGPQRPMFGTIRSMSSEQTARQAPVRPDIKQYQPERLGAEWVEARGRILQILRRCGTVLVRTENLQCASCRASLELSRPSRVLAAALGLCIGLGAVRCLTILSVRGGWILAIVVGLVGYGMGSAAALCVISDLVVRRQEEPGGFPHFRP